MYVLFEVWKVLYSQIMNKQLILASFYLQVRHESPLSASTWVLFLSGNPAARDDHYLINAIGRPIITLRQQPRRSIKSKQPLPAWRWGSYVRGPRRPVKFTFVTKSGKRLKFYYYASHDCET